MKTTIKSLMAVAVALFFSSNVNAQEPATLPESAENYDQGFRLGFGLNAGYVFDDPYDFALGGDVRLQYDLSKRTSVTLTTGFTNLFIGDDIKDLGFIPVKAGFKGFIWEDQFYLLGEVGAGFAVTNDYDQTSLILSPGIGYANKYIDLSLRYEYYSDFPTANDGEGVGQLALRLAYGFRL
ncbi:hypothetical protein ACI6PS_06100 [Flavobacterium sp. PLA-1-15]|uniref:hypothetical protein n=1 Tax=Flavobacterium sp. PLA-1-15 TaxID=3380533 RepID=UPI003B766D15